MTIETKLNHSPAPWVVSDNTATPYGQLTVDSEQSGAVAICYTVERGENAAPRECLANARLISAAPDLLACLLDLRRAWLAGRVADVEGILTGDVLADAVDRATG